MPPTLITMNVMRRVFANVLVLLVCAGLLAPSAAANLGAMRSHEACVRSAGMHHSHDHCVGMAAETMHGFSAVASAHDCCHQCCLGLARTNQIGRASCRE